MSIRIYDMLKRFESIMDHIEINDGEDWGYDAHVASNNVLRFRLSCRLPDTNDPDPTMAWRKHFNGVQTIEKQHGRWWFIDYADLKDEEHVIKVVWMAYETYMKHELMERFRYQGNIIFNPHQRILKENNNARTSNDQSNERYSEFTGCR